MTPSLPSAESPREALVRQRGRFIERRRERWEVEHMRAVVQRVARARVQVDGETVGSIEQGLLVLVGIAEGDTEQDLEWLARKLVSLRVFPDEAGKMNRSVTDISGSALLVSQFTLCADVGKGTRPSFGSAMEPGRAEPLFEQLVRKVAETVPVATGRFGANMQVELTNDGPVTLWLDTARGEPRRAPSAEPADKSAHSRRGA